MDKSPKRTQTTIPIPIERPTPTPSPQPDLVLVSNCHEFLFSLNRYESIGSQPTDLTSFDGNRDGKPDFLSADFGADTATLLLSQGRNDGYFRMNLSAGGEGCLNVTVDDLDRDGWDDLILLTAFDSRIQIYWGEESMKYEEFTSIVLVSNIILPTDRSHSARLRLMTTGSFCREDVRQIAVAGSDYLEIFSVGTNRSITREEIYPLQIELIQLLSVDLNRDHMDELVFTCEKPSLLNVYSCLTNPPQKLLAKNLDEDMHGDTPYGLISGLMNGDSSPDIAVYTFSGKLYMGFGDGAFGIDWNCKKIDNFVMRDITGGDYDGDGEWEIVLAGWDIVSEKSCLALVCATRGGQYDNPILNPVARTFPLNQYFIMTSVDLNRDVLLDLVMTDRVKNQLVFFVNQTELADNVNDGE